MRAIIMKRTSLKRCLFFCFVSIVAMVILYWDFTTCLKYPAMKENDAAPASNENIKWLGSETKNSSEKRGIPYDVILNSYMRSGSTITGKILSQVSNTFYVFEPLWLISKFKFYSGTHLFCDYARPDCVNISEQVTQTRDLLNAQGACNFISDILNCSFHKHWKLFVDRAFAEFKHVKHDWTFHRGPGWQKYKECRKNSTNSFQACLKEVEPVCRSAKHRATKLLRMTLDNLGSLLLSNRHLKVIHLFRDPRGILNSHLHTSWYPLNMDNTTAVRDDVRVICSRMLQDIHAGEKLLRKYPNRIWLLKYEQLDSPNQLAKDINTFLEMDYKKISFSQQIFIEQISKSTEIRGFHPFSYRTTLTWEIVEMVDRECAEVLEQLGYPRFRNESELRAV